MRESQPVTPSLNFDGNRSAVLCLHVPLIHVFHKRHQHSGWDQWLGSFAGNHHRHLRDYQRPPVPPLANRLENPLTLTGKSSRDQQRDQDRWRMERGHGAWKSATRGETLVQPLFHAAIVGSLYGFLVSQLV